MSRRIAPAAFFISGIAGLVLQVAWFRLLALSLGGTLAATTAVLSAFMAGLAAGALFFGPRAAKWRRPLRAYAMLELGAAAAALLSLPLLAGLDAVYPLLAGPLEDVPSVLLGVKVVLAGLVLVPTTFLLGGTLPVLCQDLARRPETSGTRAGGLYALNTWGAVGGTVLAAFVLMPRVGLSGSVAIAAGLDVLAALLVLGAGWLAGSSSAPPPAVADEAPDAETARRGRTLVVLLFLVGLAGVGYEVLWTRVLAFYFGSGAQAFALVLAVVLAGLALGAFLGGWLADRTGRPLLVLAGSQVLVAVAVLVQVWRFPVLPDFLYQLALRFEGRISFEQLLGVLLTGAVQLLLPATVAMGAALPAAVRALVRREGEAGAVVGRLAGANMLGTIPGAIAAAWVLVPLAGTQGAMLLLAALNVAVAGTALLLAVPPARRVAVILGAAASLAGLVVVAATVDPQRVFSGSGALGGELGEQELLLLEESAHGTVSLTRIHDSRGRWLSLSIDGVNVAGTAPPLLACQIMQGHLPLLLHAAPRRILHVGFGSGGTAAAVATHPEVESIEVAEINPTVLRVAAATLPEVSEDVLHDPRLRVRLVDGRNHVLGTSLTYDCILSDSVHPRYRGNSSLYTVEYFRACRAHLNPGGLVSTWLPIYGLSHDSLSSILASLREVFPATSVWYVNSTLNEFVIVVGRMEGGPLPVARMREALSGPAVRESLGRIGIDSVADVLDFYVAEGDELEALIGSVPLHHDDRPWVELESAAVLDRNASWLANLRRVVAVRTSVAAHLGAGEEELAAKMVRRHAATSAQLEGQLLLLAGAPRERWREAFAKARELAPDDREPWEGWGPPPWVAHLVAAIEERQTTEEDP